MKHFALKKQTAEFSFQSRTENAGEEKKPAATIHLKQVVSNEVLEMLGSHLRESFYRKELPADDPTDLADQGLAPKDGLTRLKHPKITSAIEYGEVLENYHFELYYGITDEPAVKLGGCKVDGFKILPLEGGSVEIKYRIACHPDEAAAGKMHTMNGSEVTYNVFRGKAEKKAQRDLADEE